MTSEKQTEANRRNAKRSTGPQTSKGKAKSSQNAFVHGVLSKKFASGLEDLEVYEDLLARMIAEQEPMSALEFALVERLTNLLWRERRLGQAEEQCVTDKIWDAALIAPSMTMREKFIPLQDQLLIGRYQGMLGRQFRETLRDLREEQERRMQTIEHAVVVTRDAER